MRSLCCVYFTTAKHRQLFVCICMHVHVCLQVHVHISTYGGQRHAILQVKSILLSITGSRLELTGRLAEVARDPQESILSPQYWAYKCLPVCLILVQYMLEELNPGPRVFKTST